MSEPLRQAVPEAIPATGRRWYAPGTGRVSATRAQQLVKTAMDVMAGTVLAVLATPVIIVLAAVLGVRLRQWPFFMHHRIGHRGRMMTFPKLRTLPRRTAPYALKNGGTVVPVDRLCAFLRRRHLDELPQLWLVPLLRMSLVGPRPKMPDRWEPAHPGYRDARCLVRQGCTGLWQIGNERHRLVHERPDYDFCYLQFGSIRMDLWILWRTLLMMFGGRTIALEEVPTWTLGRGWVSEDQVRVVGATPFLVRRGRLAVERNGR
ncbi:sugar transferase [Haloechinothrix sp. LS1_15]|uniref:sugar transferase n=1 Tax=Haloechinothrix sp. LS1_15 TaxID=2652248 RepID=UPI0029452873|nr:sugar transferase [Haloechinothrix sp. LS1_15]MDV6013571.1 sugar transferase [Haloechinothrix sp. LS1_15]